MMKDLVKEDVVDEMLMNLMEEMEYQMSNMMEYQEVEQYMLKLMEVEVEQQMSKMMEEEVEVDEEGDGHPQYQLIKCMNR